MSNPVFSQMNLLDYECKYNLRTAYRKLPDGSLVPYEVMVCNRYIFNPDGVKRSAYARKLDYWDEYRAAHEEIFNGVLTESHRLVLPPDKAANIERSRRRAARAVRELILCNDFDMFVTLTLDADKIARDDYGAIIKKLNAYLDNRVRRNGLYYVGVPELHKKGGIHFHFLCNSSALQLVDSGTVSVKGRKRPIKVSTADRQGIPLDERQTVYNIADWSLGFTTAIYTYGSQNAVARYVGKYLTKGTGSKIGGRWYYSGGKLTRAVYKYDKVDFDAFDNYSYGFDCDGGSFKVVVFNE